MLVLLRLVITGKFEMEPQKSLLSSRHGKIVVP